MKEPLCFVLMPFGRKTGADGRIIDFDRVYGDLIAPAITAAGLQPLRADQETAGGIIHKPMFERLILSPFALADLTQSNANVYYELGVRHAFRPGTTVLIVAEGNRLPFDVQMLRTIHYRLDDAGVPTETGAAQAAIAAFFAEAKKGITDSPVFQLIDGLKPAEVDHLKTDVFRDRVEYSEQIKQKLAAAVRTSVEAVRAVEQELGRLEDVESGVLIDLLLSYRARSAWQDVADLAKRLPEPLASTVLVREQLGMALNRLKRREEAEQVLRRVIGEKGPSSETLGLLGRVFKDRWEEAKNAGQGFLADGLLDQAMDAYLKGFESDWRDAYPGVNAVTLMELKEPPDERREKILPLVRYAVERKMAQGKPDYWDYATLLELAVLAGDKEEARKSLGKALAMVRARWEPETTLRNLRLIGEARKARGTTVAWQAEVEAALEQRAKQ
jgi:tetratricopeptide (TPR) repeat protein